MSNNGLGMTALRDFDADPADMLLQGVVTEVPLWQLSLSCELRSLLQKTVDCSTQ